MRLHGSSDRGGAQVYESTEERGEDTPTVRVGTRLVGVDGACPAYYWTGTHARRRRRRYDRGGYGSLAGVLYPGVVLCALVR